MSHNSLRQALDALIRQHKEFIPPGTALWWSTPEQPNTVMVNARQAKADKRLEAKASVLVTWELDAVPPSDILKQALIVLVQLSRKRALPIVSVKLQPPVVAQISRTDGLVLYDVPLDLGP